MSLSQAEGRLLAWWPAWVLGSSLAGLLRVLQVFGAVWAANLWGDLLFTAGTLAAFLAAWRIGVSSHPVAGAFAGAFLHWLVYALSFSVTGPALDGDAGVGFLGLRPGNPIESAWLTLQVGWPGILADGTACGTVAWRLRRRPAASASA